MVFVFLNFSTKAQENAIKLSLSPSSTSVKEPLRSALIKDLFFINGDSMIVHSLIDSFITHETDKANLLVSNTIKGKRLYDDNLSDQALDYLLAAIKIAEDPTFHDSIKFIAFEAFGQYLYHYQSYSEAIKYLTQARSYMKNYRVDTEAYFQGRIDGIILQSYYALNDERNILIMQGKLLTDVSRYGTIKQQAMAFNSCGLFAHKWHNYSLADSLFVYALELCRGFDPDAKLIFTHNIRESYAHTLFKLGHKEQAIAFINEAYTVNKKAKRNKQVLRAWNYLLKYQLEMENYKDAYNIYLDGMSFFGKNPLQGDDIYLAYENMIRVLSFSGHQGIAGKLSVQYNEYLKKQNDLFEKRMRNRYQLDKYVSKMISNYEYSNKQQQAINDFLSNKLRNRNYLIIIILLASIIGVGLVFYFMIIRRKLLQANIEKQKQSSKIIALENEKLKYKLDLREKDIQLVVSDNRVRTAFKKEISKRLKKIQSHPTNQKIKDLNMLSLELDQAIGFQDQLSLLQDNIDKINATFEESLRSKIPKITLQEIKVCNLIKLGMDNHQIAVNLNKASGTIRTYKFRLKKKAALNIDETLEQFIFNL